MSEYEQERVLCEDCGQSDAVCTVAVMMGSQVMHRRLCQACMAKASMSIAAGNLGKVLGAIMAAARNAHQSAEEPAADPALSGEEAQEPPEAPQADAAGQTRACDRCGMTYDGFRRGGRLGCAACCDVFRAQILEQLRRSAPQALHTGRRPLHTEAALRSRARQESLQRQLEEAVAREAYEEAATLRDALRSLTAQEEQGHE